MHILAQVSEIEFTCYLFDIQLISHVVALSKLEHVGTGVKYFTHSATALDEPIAKKLVS